MNNLFPTAPVWLDCELLYSPSINIKNEFVSNKFISTEVSKFSSKINRKPRFNVWYDTKENKTFGMDEDWTNSTSMESSFICSPRDFLRSTEAKNRYDLNFVLSFYGKHFGRNLYYDNEIMFLNHKKLHKFKGSKILVLAGGPSAKNYSWNENDYDYIFSCNHFFLSPKISKVNVDFAVVGGEIDMSEENLKFHEYFSKNETLLCFEDRMSPASARFFPEMRQKYKNRCVYMHPRYRGKPGVGLRLLLYASFLKPSEIHFAGIDGMGPDTKKGDLHDHAFQKDKKYSHKALNYGVYRRHYVLFWDYVINYLKLHKTIKFQNLGEGMDRNQSTTISKHYFPMENK